MLHSGYVSGLPLAAIGSLLWCEKWRGKTHGRIWIAADRVRLPFNISSLATNNAKLSATGLGYIQDPSFDDVRTGFHP